MRVREFVKDFGVFFLVIIAIEMILALVLGALLIAGVVNASLVTVGAMLIGIGVGFPIFSTIMTFLVNMSCCA